MYNKRLMSEVADSKKFIYQSVFYQWLKLILSMIFLWRMGWIIEKSILGTVLPKDLWMTALVLLTLIPIRGFFNMKSHKMAFYAIEPVKKNLRSKLYQKLLELEGRNMAHLKTSEVIQVATEGIEGIEIYIGRFMPQLFYCMLAPFTLFIFIASFSFSTALVLFIGVPLIPLSIVAFQKVAKKIMKGYWHSYTELGEDFLDNIQGLTTLKIYGADKKRHEEMNAKSQVFRKATMKLLSIQLNSIILMNTIAYGGAGLAIVMAYQGYMNEAITLSQTFLIIMLGAEFFIPVRLLGSFFHVAMNSTTACEKLFYVLDLEVDHGAENPLIKKDEKPAVALQSLDFGYDGKPLIFKDFDFSVNHHGLVGIVGQSGLGKSTLAHLILRKHKPLKGKVTLWGQDIDHLSHGELMKALTFVGHESMLFKGSVASLLRMGDPNASDEALWDVLKKVKMDGFVQSEGGLSYKLETGGNNLSGGQRQRLALARALLSSTEVYIFDEATSNIDQESEWIIMEQIEKLSKVKPVILISHKLSHVINAQEIYCILPHGKHVKGKHHELMETCKTYRELFTQQEVLIKKNKEDQAIA